MRLAHHLARDGDSERRRQLHVYCSTADMGQGSDTAMAQIAGEVLNMAAESITVVHSDTDVTPYDMATLGSRSLFHMGNAVKLAAEEVVQKLTTLRKEELGLAADCPIATSSRRSTACRRET